MLPSEAAATGAANGLSSAAPDLAVVAALIQDDSGRILLTRRSASGEHAGLWEFPGGKIESGEDARAALFRELREELDIEADPVRRVHRVRWPEAGRTLILDLWRTRILSGTPRGCQGQALDWFDPAVVRSLPMPPADVPLCSALRLEEIYWITPPLAGQSASDLADWLRQLDRRITSGIRMIQLRLPGCDVGTIERVADDVSVRCSASQTRWLLNGSIDDARRLGADGVHLTGLRLDAMTESERDRAGDLLIGASCHDVEQLAGAAWLHLDYATLSPFRTTATHPDAAPLGERHFAALVRECPLPVYALGGVGPGDLDRVRELGGFGVAGIRGF